MTRGTARRVAGRLPAPPRFFARPSSAGFTLIELLINIAIIGVLVAIAIPAYTNFRDRAVTARAQYDLRLIADAIQRLATDTEEWPGHQTVGQVTGGKTNEVWDLSTASAGLLATDGQYKNWRGPYLQAVPKDPWGMDYFFDTDYSAGGRKRVAVGSFGPNKCCQKKYDGDEIVIWMTP